MYSQSGENLRTEKFPIGGFVYSMLTGRIRAMDYIPIGQIFRGLILNADPFFAADWSEERGSRYAPTPDARKAFAPLDRSGANAIMASLMALLALALGGGLFLAQKMDMRSRTESSAVAQRSEGGNDSNPPGGPGNSGSGNGAGSDGASQAANSGSTGQETQQIHFEPLADQPIDATLIPLSATASSGLRVHFSLIAGPAKVIGSQVMLTGLGLVTVRATQPGDATHAAATPVEQSFHSVAPGPVTGPRGISAIAAAPAQRQTQTLTFEAPANAVVGDPPIEVAAHSDSNLPVTITVVSGPAKMINNQVMLTGSGKVTLRAEQVGDPHFLPAASVEKSFTVDAAIPAKLTVTLPGNIEMVFVRVPAGRALLGSPVGEMGRTNEEAQHDYIESEGFLMSATEVTQAQYEAVTGKRPSYSRSEWQNRPVEQVRWSDLNSYNTGATTGFFPQFNAVLKEQKNGRWTAMLPSDDQWEYACRAGSSTPLNNNTELTIPLPEADIRAVATYGASETTDVGTHTPNAWGLYDMHGNVAEWTQEGSLRGGSYRDEPASIRSASKIMGQSGNSNPDRHVGFRILLRRVNPKAE